jgi:phosphoenolpyruvate carboxykinase (ATP)
MDIRLTRAMIKAALEGELKHVKFKPHPVLKVFVPSSCPGVPTNVLDPRNTWEDKKAYDEKALDLARRFQKNFEKFPNASKEIKNAGPEAD